MKKTTHWPLYSVHFNCLLVQFSNYPISQTGVSNLMQVDYIICTNMICLRELYESRYLDQGHI